MKAVPFQQAVSLKWSEPAVIFTYEDPVVVPAVLVTGKASGILHLFFHYRSYIYHAYWTGAGWTTPNEVIAPPTGLSAQPLYFEDPLGQVHVFWIGGDGAWHAHADARFADDARVWSPAERVLDERPAIMAVADGSFTHEDPRAWHIAWVPMDGQVLYYQRYDESTGAVSEPVMITETFDRDQVLNAPSILAVPNGDLLVAWSPAGAQSWYPFKGIVTASSEDGGETWDPPQSIIEGCYAPGLFYEAGQVLRIANGCVGSPARYVQFSTDGETWTDMVDFTFGTKPGSGLVQYGIASDSASVLHFSMATGGPSGYDMPSYVGWDGTGWSSVQSVAPPGMDGQTTTLGISEGNRVHIIWSTAQTLRESIAVAPAPRINIPELPQTPSAAISPRDAISQTVPATSTPEFTKTPVPLPSEAPQAGSTLTTPVILGVLPAALIVLAVVILSFRRTYRR